MAEFTPAAGDLQLRESTERIVLLAKLNAHLCLFVNETLSVVVAWKPGAALGEPAGSTPLRPVQHQSK
ncbi:hypothetical protein [Microcoleus sp. FACHB-68]|uniref:hypothetical protein n=1 Tax=Microcoleus sp. FACHB-68 TaxID=2692826 RepID=UPI00168835CF|nr:hypothetical protein [Microcoleus sp. FACHB-68]MBD1940289.1 hypothetical protein [Microcoleus sp. FACHB-68]